MAVEVPVNGGEYADNFNVRASLKTIGEATRLHKGLIWLTVLMTLGLMTIYVVLWPPVYRANAILMAEKDIDSARDSFYTNFSVFRKDDAQTEVELMRAGPILQEVIKREHLTYNDVYHPFFSHLAYLWRKTPIAKGIKNVKNRLFPDADSSSYGPSEQTAVLGDILADMYAGISIEPVGETTVGKLTLRGPSRRVANITNTLLEVYQERRTQRHSEEAGSSVRTLSEQAEVAKKELDAAGEQRLAFVRANNVTYDLHKETVEVGKLAELETDIAAARSRIAALEATVSELDKLIAEEPPTKTSLTVFDLNVLREASKRKRLELETALLQDRGRFREDSPEIRDQKADIEKLDKLIAEHAVSVETSRSEALNNVRQELLSKRKGLRAELEGARAGRKAMEENAAQLSGKLSGLPRLQNEVRALDRDYALALERYNLLMVKKSQAAVSETVTKALMPSLRVVEYAVPPSDKSWPSLKILYPSALLVGLLLGIAAAVLRYYTSGQVRKDDLARRTGQSPLYGHIRISAESRPVSISVLSRASEPGSGRLTKDAS